MTATRAGRVGPVLALLLALAAGPGAGGCGKYGRPVRSAPPEARDLGAAEPDATVGFEADRPAEQPQEPEEDGGETERAQEQPEQGESE